MTDERESSLPKWAQQLIKDLRSKLQAQRDPLLDTIDKLSRQVEKLPLLQARNGAIMELLQKAAEGGHVSSKVVVDTLNGYGLELIKED